MICPNCGAEMEHEASPEVRTNAEYAQLTTAAIIAIANSFGGKKKASAVSIPRIQPS